MSKGVLMIRGVLPRITTLLKLLTTPLLLDSKSSLSHLLVSPRMRNVWKMLLPLNLQHNLLPPHNLTWNLQLVKWTWMRIMMIVGMKRRDLSTRRVETVVQTRVMRPILMDRMSFISTLILLITYVLFFCLECESYRRV
jgi:hypothetical protein